MSINIIDQTGHIVSLAKPAVRIVSLVPSQTEWLAYLGLDQEIVGITKFCVHPPSLKKRKLIVGGTKSVHFDRIESLNPDLVIGNKEENTQDMILTLREKYPCYTSDVGDIQDAIKMMQDLGTLTGKELQAKHFTDYLTSLIKGKKSSNRKDKKLSAAYVIWNDPIMVAGSNTYINSMMELMGLVNVFKNKVRYPEISCDEFKNASPDMILLSSEPYPFREVHKKQYSELAPDAGIELVDGELFSWYGWRIIKALIRIPDLIKNIHENSRNALHLDAKPK